MGGLALQSIDHLLGGTATEVYTGLVLGWTLGACGVPIPEEAVFAVGGALAAQDRVHVSGVYLLGWAVVLALDGLLFGLGARFGPRLEASRWGRRVGPLRWAAMRGLVARRGIWAVAGARFVMGARIPTFVLAGALGLPARRFLPAVALTGLVTAAIPLSLGYAFAAHLDVVLDGLHAVRWSLLALALLLLGFFLVRALRRRRSRLLVDRDLAPALRSLGIDRPEALLDLGDPGEPRRFVGFVDLPLPDTGGRFHLKRYRYAGWRASLGLFGRGTLAGTAPEVAEFEALAVLRGLGVGAVRPVAACAVLRGGRLVAHALLTEVVPDAEPLDVRLHRAADPLRRAHPLRRALCRRLGEELRAMHAAGFLHRDLHARNVLVRTREGDVETWLLDCRRGSLGGRGRPEDDLAALDHDLDGVLSRTDRLRVLRAWLDDAGQARSVARAIRRRRARLPPPRAPRRPA